MINAKKTYDGRETIINAFKDKIFPLNNPSDIPQYASKEDKLNDLITKYDMIINKELFRKYFYFQSLSDMQEILSKTQNTQENKKLVQVIISGLVDLNKEVKKMSKDEIKIEEPHEIVDTVAEILDFNEQYQ